MGMRILVRPRVLLGIDPAAGKHRPMHESPGADEVFDVVDEHDRIVAQAPRREVHGRGLRHRAVHVLVFNPTGEVFLQKRSMTKDTAAGLWDSSASGHLNAGEDYDACAVRELCEEIGLNVRRPPSRWLRLEACPESGNEFVWVYRLTTADALILNSDEIERGVWLMPREVSRLACARPAEYASSFRLIWRTLTGRHELPG